MEIGGSDTQTGCTYLEVIEERAVAQQGCEKDRCDGEQPVRQAVVVRHSHRNPLLLEGARIRTLRDCCSLRTSTQNMLPSLKCLSETQSLVIALLQRQPQAAQPSSIGVYSNDDVRVYHPDRVYTVVMSAGALDPAAQ